MSLTPPAAENAKRDPLTVSTKALLELNDLIKRRAPIGEFVRAADAAIRRVEYLIAYDTTSAAQELYAGDAAAMLRDAAHRQHHDYVRLRQKRAEALAKAGAIDRARLVLEELRALDAGDPETLGFLARLDKDVWDANRETPEAARLLETALDSYERAYETTKAYWHGINAATLAVCADRHDRARALAEAVKTECDARLSKPSANLTPLDRYWLLATLGEASLVLGNPDDAGQWYEQAAALAVEAHDYSSISSTRRNARMLLRHRGQDLSLAAQWLPTPPVLVFSGHLLDRPDRAAPRFPASLVPDVDRLVRQKIDRQRVSFAFASAACGADLIVAKAVLDAGGNVHVVLPFERRHFIETSVGFAGEEWVRRFNDLLDDPTGRVKVTVLSRQPSRDHSNDYEYANRVMFGLARAKSLEMGTDLVALAVWDGKSGDGPGGSASNVARWRASEIPVEIVDLGKLARSRGGIAIETSAQGTDVASAKPQAATYLDQQPNIAAMLFADAKGFSELPDESMEAFAREYLDLVARVIADDRTQDDRHRPAIVNTWGDGLYMVFDRVRDAGIVALRLCERIEEARADGRLSIDIRLRVALHAGPVLRCHNAVTNRPDVIGVHVNRAARLEPSTPTGHVYATEPFVALAYAEHVKEFRCDYVGPTRLAKDFGTEPAYHVRWVGNRRATAS